jgi:5'-nucleotidase
MAIYFETAPLDSEAVVIGRLFRRTYAFIGLEGAGGIMVYDISDPSSPSSSTM